MDANVSFLFDHSNDFLCVTDKSGTILHTNVGYHYESRSDMMRKT